MTGLIRCFPPPPRSRSGESSRWACLPPFEFSVGTRGSEELALHFKRKKLDVFPIRVQFSSLKSQLLPSSDCLFFKKDTLLMFRSGRVQYNNILGFCHGITEAITYHKVLTSAKALVVVQVLMFILPPNVLAETCKTENSFFNMPFLFIIALIGATVGGASLQRQGKYKEAIKYHSKVLEIASKVGENSGITEAYGAIADCYTELGDLEKAGKFYDQYIARLEKD
ncbi:uncharacterized protein LOC110038386 [Phalaenopsis equestris]|uniref:uncharacterized protein LOC110038386 n=1 Tax=Phalaenopsis equestris TaxID=78828 RepID=UPI0009E3EAF9|nr:uncharacterized protein LOC110038386 [Phalaenopsis equestris]